MIHDLQQDVEQIGMGLFDFIEKQHCIRVLDDAVRKQPPLLKTDIPRRRTDQAGHRMLLHVLTHVKAQELNPHLLSQLLGHFGLTNPRRPGKQEGASGLFRMTETGPSPQH